MNSAEAQKQKLSTQVKELSSELAQSRSELTSVQHDASTLRGRLDATNSELLASQDELRKAKADTETRGNQAEQLLSERDLLIADIRQLQFQIDQATAETAVERATQQALQDRIEEERRTARNRKTILGSAVLTIGAEADARQNLLEEEYQTTSELKAKLQAAYDEVADLKHQLESIYQSRSWAVTKPMRAARRVFPGK